MKDQLSEKQFVRMYRHESTCLEQIFRLRTINQKFCINPNCKGILDRDYCRLKGRRAYLCKKCLIHIYPTVDSFFENTKVELPDFFQIIFKILYNRNGVSASEICRGFGYTYPTALNILHKIRSFMGECLIDNLIDSVVEIDESYVNTGTKGLGRHFKFRRGRGSYRHTSILVIAERNGSCKLIKIPSTDKATILPEIIKHVDKSCIIYTDDWGAYNTLKELGYEHFVVNHSLKEFKKESASTNTAENIFSNLKRAISGTYRNVSDHKLQNYLNEAAFRHTYRNEYDYGFMKLLQKLGPLSSSYRNNNSSAA